MRTTLQALWLFAPLLVSAALSGAVIRLGWWRALARPIDAGAMVRGRRLFGDSKTWRGVVTAVVGSVAAVALQRLAHGSVPAWLEVVDYGATSPLLLGAALGVGATAGELPNSFVKRQLGIAPGKTTSGVWAIVFFAWDQVDLVVGAWPLLALFVRPTAPLVAASFVLALVLHPAVAFVGWAIGARKTAR